MALELRIAGERRLLVDPDRVHVRGAEPGRDLDAVLLGMVDCPVEQETHSLAAVGFDDGVDRVEPLLRLDGIVVGDIVEHLDDRTSRQTAAYAVSYRDSVTAPFDADVTRVA